MGKFEKHNRPAAQQPPAPAPRSSQGAFETPKGAKKKNKKKISVLPIILGVLIIAVGIAAGILCTKLFGDSPIKQPDLIRPDTYIAGVNVGGLEKEAALELLMQSYPPLTPPATNAEGVQEPIYSRIYKDQNMNIRLYTTPAQIELFHSDYDPSTEVEVDIYGKPLVQEETEAESSSTEETEAMEESTEASESESSESTETTVQESTDYDPDAPVNEEGAPYILDRTICLPASQVNITLDLTAAVDRAFSLGRETEGATELPEGRLDVDLRDLVTMDDAYIREVLQRAYEDTLLEGADTTVEKGKTTVKNEKGEDMEVDCLTITFGTMSRKLDTEALFTQVMEGYFSEDFDQQAVYEEILPTVLDLDRLYGEEGCFMPVNAVCDPTTFVISEEKIGYGFLMRDALALAEAAAPGDQITLTLMDLQPKYTKEEMQKLLFSDVLGKCKSPHVYNPVRTKNLDIASKAINGTVLLPGEVFSFNNVVGERTAAKGYGEAGVYVGGRTENQLGGGVCQVASAIYYSCLKADLEIVKRYEHRYVPSYVPWGMDATIYWGSLDYKFRNNTPYPIRIDVSVHDGAVFVELVGTNTKDYTVKLDYRVESEEKHEVKKIYIHPDMKNYSEYSKYKHGETLQVGYDGCVVKTYMYKYDLDGNLIATIRVNTSKYARRDKEVAHVLDPSRPMQEQIDAIENPNKPTEPKPTEPTEPKPTEPTEPTQPTEPEPTETTEPTEPEPTETTEPTEPEPTETTAPSENSGTEGENGEE